MRERLDIAPGTEVEIHEEDGRAVVEPEKDPPRIIDRMEELIEDADSDRLPQSYDDLDPIARDHADAIRRGAQQADRDDK